MNSIFNINDQLRDLMENEIIESCIDKETGEVLFDKINETLDNLIIARNDKLETVALWIKELKAEAEAIKAEEAELKKRREAKTSKIESLKNYLDYNLKTFGDKRFETPKVVVSYRKSTQVIVDEERLDHDYWREKITYEPDKVKIKEAIGAGVYVAGAHIEEKDNIQIK